MPRGNRGNNRREFLKTTAATGIGYWVAGGVQAQESNSPNERVAMASIGLGGKGSSDSRDAAARGDMVAICDVDKRTLAAGVAKFEGAKPYTDFRRMLDEMGKSIDAVTVSTPDHTHAPAALMAMRMGKHCFCQKPLAHSIYEARLMGQVAREMGVATQMGNQGTAGSGLRRSAAVLRAGLLGKVSEVHIWTNRPIWPQGTPRPEPAPVPENLDWDAWLTVAPKRPYAPGYHTFKWRGWWDFGTGALGDIACHSLSMAFMGLDLINPTTVRAETSGHNKDSFPKWSIITYEFAANESRGPIKFVWYDGGKVPPADLLDGRPATDNGKLVIAEKGYVWGDDTVVGDVDVDSVDFPVSTGHFQEWVDAIKGGRPAMSNFPNYSGPLTETVLVGNLAVWLAADGDSGKVEWDGENMKVKNVDGLEPLIKPTYPKGYTLDV
ncbi:MAG TPA: Gfo/Idh/MocA family oxidoreductase [Thermoguttaceae bacterium]|nr:Gfo/Idh/MocA family oxidoreductase [Thermoguttaceae bacterium]